MLLIKGQYVNVPIRMRFGRAMARNTRKSLRLRPDQRFLPSGTSRPGSCGGVLDASAGIVLLLASRVVMGHLRQAN